MRHLYNAKIDFQESTKVDDDYGTSVKTWADVSGLTNIPCRINWQHGMARGESIVNDKIVWIRDCKVYCAYYSNITAAMRAVYNDENYNIVDFGNVDEAGKFMTIILKKEED